MANLFSGNAEKKIPRDLKSCYKIDSLTRNLWMWCERIEQWGKFLFWILIIVGVFTILAAAIDAYDKAYYGEELFSVSEVVFKVSLKWVFYSFLEYCIWNVSALLIGSLATLVQHTKITANVTLYNSAKTEGVTDDYKQESDRDNTGKIKSYKKGANPLMKRCKPQK